MIFFYAYIGIWLYVHLRFQQNFWIPNKTGKTVFSKYGDISDSRTGEQVYYIKAVQFMVCTILTVIGVDFVDAFMLGCVVYVAFMFSFFELQRYHLLNGSIVLGMVVERLIILFK